jgi:hypothetical protein
MLKKALTTLLILALLWLWGCTGIDLVNDPGATYGNCAKRMPYYYCGGNG